MWPIGCFPVFLISVTTTFWLKMWVIYLFLLVGNFLSFLQLSFFFLKHWLERLAWLLLLWESLRNDNRKMLKYSQKLLITEINRSMITEINRSMITEINRSMITEINRSMTPFSDYWNKNWTLSRICQNQRILFGLIKNE